MKTKSLLIAICFMLVCIKVAYTQKDTIDSKYYRIIKKDVFIEEILHKKTNKKIDCNAKLVSPRFSPSGNYLAAYKKVAYYDSLNTVMI